MRFQREISPAQCRRGLRRKQILTSPNVFCMMTAFTPFWVFWDDPDQWSKITPIMVHRRNRWRIPAGQHMIPVILTRINCELSWCGSKRSCIKPMEETEMGKNLFLVGSESTNHVSALYKCLYLSMCRQFAISLSLKIQSRRPRENNKPRLAS